MRKALTVPVPKGVFSIRKPSGRIYWYFQFGRGTPGKGKLHRLPDDPQSAEFWAAIERLTGTEQQRVTAGTFAALILQYRNPGNPNWTSLSDNTRRDYSIYLDHIKDVWGSLPVKDVTAPDILALRDSKGATPIAANHLVSVLKTLLQWAVLRGWRGDNPAREVPRFESSEPHKPWPEDLFNAVLARAKDSADDIYRALYLLRWTGQRQSDVLRLRPADRHDIGFRFRIQKTSTDHFVPLRAHAVAEIDSWTNEPMVPFCMSSVNSTFDTNTFRARFNRWIARRENADIDAWIEREDVSLHGIRALAACTFRLDGISHQEIASMIGMSVQMVSRYTKRLDQEIAAREAMGRVESLQRSRSFTASSGPVPLISLQGDAGKSKG